MAKIPYLFRRKNVYYFRLVVPAELRNTLKVREIIQSLKTEKRAEAIPLALKLAGNITAYLHDLKRGNTDYHVSHLGLIQQAYKKAPRTVLKFRRLLIPELTLPSHLNHQCRCYLSLLLIF